MKEKVAKLIDLKSIITLLMVLALVLGFFMDKINASELIPLVTMILTFYFTKKETVKEKERESDNNDR